MNEHDEPVAVVNNNGKRAVSWSVELGVGPLTVQHEFPDAVQHHYQPPGHVDADVWLYQGEFFRSDDHSGYAGDVRWRWRPSTHIEVHGTGPAVSSGLCNFLSSNDSVWFQAPALVIDLPDGELPQQPPESAAQEPNQGHSIAARVEQELGNPSGLERVTFFVPNGWDGHDGRGICDPADLTRCWYGRTEAAGGGWSVTLDRLAEMDLVAWRELQDLGGRRFTHVGRLVRDDGTTFTAAEAFEALARVRLGLNLALGRRTTCALPVGWRGTRPVWCRWRSAPVDAYRSLGSGSHWLDETVAHQQIRDVVSLVLAFTADEANRAALRSALAYYVASNVDVDVELSVAIPLSGLQLLAYYRFVVQRGSYSQTAWKKMNIEAQLRLLLVDLKVDTTVQPHFSHLTALRDRLALNGAPRDALSVVVKMRNVVTHPTRDKPGDFNVYEWAEAGMHARYWLCLALLNTVGYQGKIAAVLQEKPRWQGQLRPTPWAL